MNEIVSKLLLARDKLTREMHLKQSLFTYSACVPFTKKRRENMKIERNRRFKIYLSKRTS